MLRRTAGCEAVAVVVAGDLTRVPGLGLVFPTPGSRRAVLCGRKSWDQSPKHQLSLAFNVLYRAGPISSQKINTRRSPERRVTAAGSLAIRIFEYG